MGIVTPNSPLRGTGTAARSGVEGAAPPSITDNDPYFKAMQAEMADKGFLARCSARQPDQLGPLRLADVDDLRAGLLRRGNDAGLHAAL